MPKISVISGAYNVASLYSLDKSIKSILNQSFSDFEFIICDDGSKDESYELLSRYAEADPRIKLIRNDKNLGLAAALNHCIDVSCGEFIARHDLDDYNDPCRFEKQLAFLDSHPEISHVGTFAYLFDEDGVYGELSFPTEITKKDFLFTSPYQHGSLMFRREAIIAAGSYRVAKETRRAEDYDLFMRMHPEFQGANIDEFLYYFCEDKNAFARRKYKYRIDEAKVRWRGFRHLGLLPRGIFYVIKPLIVGLIPKRLLRRLRNKSKRRNIKENDSD